MTPTSSRRSPQLQFPSPPPEVAPDEVRTLTLKLEGHKPRQVTTDDLDAPVVLERASRRPPPPDPEPIFKER